MTSGTIFSASMQQRPQRHRQRGLSLIELMVGITIGLLIVAGMAVLFANTSQSRTELEKSSRLIENGRYATELLRDELQVAGFFDALSLVTSGYALTDPCATSVSFSSAGAAPTVTAIAPTPLFGYDNTWVNTAKSTFCTSFTASSLNYQPNTDVLVVRRASTAAPVTPASVAGKTSTQFLQVAACEADLLTTPYAVAVGGSTSLNLRKKDCSTLADVRPLVSRVYFVASCNVCTGSGADSIPTLKMLELQASTLTPVALVEGIESMQVEYLLDSDSDGVPEATSVASAIADTDWPTVAGVNLFLVVRNLEATVGYGSVRTFTMGGTTLTTGNDGIKRHLFTQSIRLTNLGLRNEKP